MDPEFFCPVHDECKLKNAKNCADCLKKLHKIPDTKKTLLKRMMANITETALILYDLIENEDNDK